MREEDNDREKEEKDFFGTDYQDYINDKGHFNLNPSIGTGKNETGTNTPGNNSMFEKIDDLNNYHPQTELRKDNIKNKEKKHKNSIVENSSKNLSKILQKKKTRGDGPTKKRKKTKSEMDFTLKNKTEINPEIKKKEIEKKIYEMYNNEYFDLYDDNNNDHSGDMLNMINDDDPNAEVNKIKPEYKSQINDIPESLDMFISSNN